MTRSGNTDEAEKEGISVSLIQRLERLDVSIPWKAGVAANSQTESSCIRQRAALSELAIFSFCFEGDLPLDAFRGWVGMEQSRTVHRRRLHQFAFVTTFWSSHERDEALQLEVAVIRGSPVIHYSWAPECENEGV
ncbi:hypothetical protein R1flu_029276 [Riccia fluitans]|uniref:Uncharacterized protein n=1 Tax=Riccia fluitans TaxID=41844 RepID=A0ABD1XP24_9MARC